MKKTIEPASALKDDEIRQQAAENKALSLDAAANLLLTMLSDPVREILTETAAITLNIPIWQLVVGLMQQAYDVGLFVTPQLDPDWNSNLPSKPMIYNQSVCPQCGRTFQPRWLKQEFCSNECGTIYQRKCDVGRVPRHVVGGQHPMGQEPAGSVSSAIRPGHAEVVAGTEPA